MDRTVSFVAGLSYGPFRLQAPLLEVVRLLRSEPTTFGVVEVQSGDAAEVADGSVVLFLPRYQARLVFDAVTQRLATVTIVNLTCAGDILYRGRVFCGGHFPATFSHVYDVLGPTFHGEVEKDHYVLQYPGMKIYFAVPREYIHLFENEDVHPTMLPNGTAPVAMRLVIESPKSEKTVSPLKTVQIGDQLSFVVGRGLEFPRLCAQLPFGSSPQDAISLLGLPSSVFAKCDDRMQVHKPSRASANSSATSAPIDYFLNMPLLGLDLLYSGLSHGLIKVVVHNPYPLHQSFLQVHKCRYSCVLPTSSWEPSTVLDNNTNWNWLQHQYKGRLPKPLISSTGCLNGAVMRLYCLEGLVIYVLPDGNIPQVVFFRTAKETGSSTGTEALEDASERHQSSRASPFQQQPSPVDRQETASYDTRNMMFSAPPPEDSSEAQTPAQTSPFADDRGASSNLENLPIPQDSPIPHDEMSGNAPQAREEEEGVVPRSHDGWDDATPTEPVVAAESPPPPGDEDEESQPVKKKKKSSKKKKDPW